MKKRIISYLMMLILLTTCACAKKTSLKETNDEELIEILIPLSFMQFAGLNTKSTMAMFEEYGEEYCTSTKSGIKGVILKVTEEQQQNLIQMNNDYVDELVAPFLEENPLYSFSGSDDYTEITFSYDEEAEPTIMVMTAMRYAMNNLLLDTSGQWEIHITIVNCHTGKVVEEGELPGRGLIINDNDWEASYAE